MLTHVEVRNVQGSLLTLQIQDVSSGLIIEEIEGLDPVKATISSSGFANLDGAQYKSGRRETRNITMRISLEPDYATHSVQDLRRQLYPFFMSNTVVNLRFCTSEGLDVDISGRVESMEAPLFTKEPAVDISIICFDPDLYDATSNVISGDTVSSPTETLIPYVGSVDTGILLTMNVDRVLADFTVHHRSSSGVISNIDVVSSFVADDVLIISTIPGDKFARQVRAAVETSILFAVSPQSSWFSLQPGDNYFYVYCSGAAIPYTLTYYDRYGGL